MCFCENTHTDSDIFTDGLVVKEQYESSDPGSSELASTMLAIVALQLCLQAALSAANKAPWWFVRASVFEAFHLHFASLS